MRIRPTAAAFLAAALLPGAALFLAPGSATAQMRPQPPAQPQPLPPPVYAPQPDVRPDVLYGNQAAYGDAPARSSRGNRGLIGIEPPALRGDRAGLTVMAGGGAVAQPRFIGSDRYDIIPIPALALMYGDWFFADPANGIGVRMRPLPGVTASTGVDYGFGRKESDSPHLRGMGDLKGGVTAFAETEFRPLPGLLQALALNVGIETPLSGDIDGFEATADLSLSVPIGGGGYASASAGAVWSNGPMMRDLFGVSPAQAAASGLPAYAPVGGVRAATFGVTAFRPITGAWNGVILANYDRLTGDAADSPVVLARDQYRLGMGVLYTFSGNPFLRN